jgi:hypothetical protein
MNETVEKLFEDSSLRRSEMFIARVDNYTIEPRQGRHVNMSLLTELGNGETLMAINIPSRWDS